MKSILEEMQFLKEDLQRCGASDINLDDLEDMKPRKPYPGTRYFKCEECSHTWSEWTRDCGSPSGDYCTECGEFNSVHYSEEDKRDE